MPFAEYTLNSQIFLMIQNDVILKKHYSSKVFEMISELVDS